MISWHDLYTVLAAMVPLYVAMILAYGSVRWWKIFTPDQCSGINRFVAVFAVPLLSFHFISTNNPYEMNFRFIAADSLQKLIILILLFIYSHSPFIHHPIDGPGSGSLEWAITLFSLSTLPNTLVMGIPLLIAMYGPYSGSLMVQVVVLQCIIWYTLLLFLYEYRGAKLLITEQFPETAASIVSLRVDSDVVSLDGREFLETDAEIGGDGRLHVTVRRSSVSRRSLTLGGGMTPRASNMTGAEIYSLSSSRNPTPRGSNFDTADLYYYGGGSGFHQHMHSSIITGRPSSFGATEYISRGPTPRPSNFDDDHGDGGVAAPLPLLPLPINTNSGGGKCNNSNTTDVDVVGSPMLGIYNPAVGSNPINSYPVPNPEFGLVGGELGKSSGNGGSSRRIVKSSSSNKESGGIIEHQKQRRWMSDDAKEFQMLVWSSTASPVSEVGGMQVFGGGNNVVNSGRSIADDKELGLLVSDPHTKLSGGNKGAGEGELCFRGSGGGEYCFPRSEEELENGHHGPNFGLSKLGSGRMTGDPKQQQQQHGVGEGGSAATGKAMPPASVMTRLILIMVWRKLIRNPNTYSSLIGLIWSLIAFRWNVEMPSIIKGSISILSDAGLGMAMFSLGLFMALQPKVIACGNSMAGLSMLVRFIAGPAVMAISSFILGLKGDLLRVAIVQAALPQGIVPFVFAKEYNNHPAILSTAVIFGMLVALPIDLLYYILLGL